MRPRKKVTYCIYPANYDSSIHDYHEVRNKKEALRATKKLGVESRAYKYVLINYKDGSINISSKLYHLCDDFKLRRLYFEEVFNDNGKINRKWHKIENNTEDKETWGDYVTQESYRNYYKAKLNKIAEEGCPCLNCLCMNDKKCRLPRFTRRETPDYLKELL